MLKIGKYVLLTRGEIKELNKILSELDFQNDERDGDIKDLHNRLCGVTFELIELANIVKSALPKNKRRVIDSLKDKIRNLRVPNALYSNTDHVPSKKTKEENL